MNSISRDFFVGVVSGLLSLIVTYFLVELWKKWLVPLYEERLYTGLEIAHEWHATLRYEDDASDNDIIYKLRRVGNRVTGIAHCINGPEVGTSWALRGTFKNLILILTYYAIDRNRPDQGTLVLIIQNKCCLLRGHISYYSYTSNCIKSSCIDLHRGTSTKTSDVPEATPCN